eukprot:8479294-Prorocentrum_lima.AAC.1
MHGSDRHAASIHLRDVFPAAQVALLRDCAKVVGYPLRDWEVQSCTMELRPRIVVTGYHGVITVR